MDQLAFNSPSNSSRGLNIGAVKLLATACRNNRRSVDIVGDKRIESTLEPRPSRDVAIIPPPAAACAISADSTSCRKGLGADNVSSIESAPSREPRCGLQPPPCRCHRAPRSAPWGSELPFSRSSPTIDRPEGQHPRRPSNRISEHLSSGSAKPRKIYCPAVLAIGVDNCRGVRSAQTACGADAPIITGAPAAAPP